MAVDRNAGYTYTVIAETTDGKTVGRSPSLTRQSMRIKESTMKKTIICLMMILTAAVMLPAQDRALVSVTGNILQPSDSDFRDIYGDTQFMPEIRADVKLFKGFRLRLSYGFYDAEGATPELDFDCATSQTALTAGISYLGKISPRWRWSAGIGVSRLGYKEEALDQEVTGSAWGPHADIGLLAFFGRHLLARIDVGYAGAEDIVEDVTIKLGGFKAGAGIGVRF